MGLFNFGKKDENAPPAEDRSDPNRQSILKSVDRKSAERDHPSKIEFKPVIQSVTLPTLLASKSNETISTEESLPLDFSSWTDVDQKRKPRRSMWEKYVMPPMHELLPGQIYHETDRPQWKERYNAVLSMIGFAVGLSNVWRFAYLCFKFGGLNFLIPYFVFQILVALPLMYLEVIVGQFTQSGMLGVWKLCPILGGVGVTQAILPIMVAFYNNAILAWSLLYCAHSALSGSKVPWVGCHNDWNTLKCRDIPADFEEVDLKDDERRAGAEFFRGRVLRRWKSKFAGDFTTTGNNSDGTPTYGLTAKNALGFSLNEWSWEMPIYLLAVYIALWLFLIRGLRTTSKNIWVTVTVPYIMMFILIFREGSLPGAQEGIEALFGNEEGGGDADDGRGNVTFSLIDHRVLNISTWVEAAEQVFFSCGTGVGTHLTLASYNPFQTDVHLDALITVIVNTVTSFLCAIIVFMALGSVAESDNAPVKDLVASGPDILFEVCVDALSRLPGSNFFCFVFFLMILFMGFECTLESLTCVKLAFFEVTGDWFEKNGNYRGTFVIFVLLVCFAAGLTCMTRGGFHVFLLLDNYTAGFPFQVCSLLLVISMAWFWGLTELCDAAEAMTGRRPSFYYQISWKFISPAVLTFSVLARITRSGMHDDEAKAVTVLGNKTDETDFRSEYQTFGHIYAYFPTFFIPIGIIIFLCKSEGKTFAQKLLLGISPNYEHDEILMTGRGLRARLDHYFYCVDCPKTIKRLTHRLMRKKKKVKVAPSKGKAVATPSKTEKGTVQEQTLESADNELETLVAIQSDTSQGAF